jgi:L-ascorbate metabolism protein UlaG (beta-lactamase superfamily)
VVLRGRELASAIRRRKPDLGIHLFWLGQSSWAVVLDTGRVVHIDPYLSDSVYRANGWHRLLPLPFLPRGGGL